MNIERMDMGTAMVIRLKGDLDEQSIEPLRKELYQCLCDGHFNLVLNVSEVGFISYMSLGIVVERLRRFRALDGDIKLVGVNTYMQRLFRMVGITALFEVYDSEAAAIGGKKAA